MSKIPDYEKLMTEFDATRKHKNHKTEYSCWTDGYDARYCVECNEWLTNKCGDSMCMYCGERPDQPLPAQKNYRAIQSLRTTQSLRSAVCQNKQVQ